MKKMAKRVFSFILSVICLISMLPLGGIVANADRDMADDFLHYFSGNNAIISGVNGSVSGKVVIPSKISGKTVIAIGNNAFSGCTGIKSITIPEKVTSIKNMTFFGCDSLTSITIPRSVYQIQSNALPNNKALTVYGYSDTEAEEYAEKNAIKFNAKKKPESPTVKLRNKSDGIEISWNKVKGAERYRIYRSRYISGQWTSFKLLKSTTSQSYVDKSTTAKIASKIKYTVYACNDAGKSEYKTSVRIRYIATPPVTAFKTGKGIKVKWNKVALAEKYYVYRSVYSNGKWSDMVRIKTAKLATSYTDTTAKKGKTYKYTVRAYKDGYYSYYKFTKKIKR